MQARHTLRRVRALSPLSSQPHAGRVAIGELDARLFEHALDGAEIVAVGHAAAFLEIDNHVARHHRALSQHRLISFICQTGAAGIGLA
jgi:hypothetical protein